MIKIKSVCTGRLIRSLLVAIFALLLAAACGGGVAPEQEAYPGEPAPTVEAPTETPIPEEPTETGPAPTEEAPTETPVPEEPTAEPSGVSITMAVPPYLAGEDFVERVYEPFEEETGIGLTIIPLGEYYEGATADVGVLSYNRLASLLLEGQLEALNDLEVVRSRSFVDESLALHTFEGQVFGVPWLRSGCAAAYENLSAFSLEDKRAAVEALFSFMTRAEMQLEIFEMRGWVPTTEEAYGQLDPGCETANVLGLQPELVSETIGQMEASAEALREVLGDQELAPGAATAVVVDGEMLARAAPVADNVPDEEAVERFNSSEGLTVGAISLLEGADLDVTGDYHAADARPGEYVVACRQEQEQEVICSLTDRDFNTFEVFAARFQGGQPSVVLPAVYAEEGSFRKCFSLDGLTICLRVG